MASVKYYGLEREFEQNWVKCGLVGVTTGQTYSEVRAALDLLEGFRVVPVEQPADWAGVFNSGRIMELTTLCTAIRILCTKEV